MSGLTAYGQKFSLEGYFTIGNITNRKYVPGKAGIGIGANYHLSDKFEAGFEAGSGGNFLPVDDLKSNEDTTFINPASFAYNTMVFRGRYYIADSVLNGKIYAGLSAGYAKFFRRQTFSYGNEVANRTLVVVPELGFIFEGFNFSLQYFPRIRTERYQELSSQSSLLLREGRFSMILLRIGYQLSIGRRH